MGDPRVNVPVSLRASRTLPCRDISLANKNPPSSLLLLPDNAQVVHDAFRKGVLPAFYQGWSTQFTPLGTPIDLVHRVPRAQVRHRVMPDTGKAAAQMLMAPMPAAPMPAAPVPAAAGACAAPSSEEQPAAPAADAQVLLSARVLAVRQRHA